MYVFKLKTLIIAAAAAITVLLLLTLGICRFAAPHSEAVSGFSETGSDEYVELPILMYHSLTKNPSKVNAYVINVSDFENDLKFLRDNGYTAVFISEVIDYVDGSGDLPDKPVAITFDDGFVNNYDYGLSLLEKYDMKCTVSIVGSYTEKFSSLTDDNPEYAYADYETVKNMADSGRYEIASHSYDMHSLPDKSNPGARKGASKNSGESDEDYRRILTEDTQKNRQLLEENCGITPVVYTYPYGAISKSSMPILKELGYRASLSCLEDTNHISRGNTDGLFCLSRYLRDNKRSAAALLQK